MLAPCGYAVAIILSQLTDRMMKMAGDSNSSGGSVARIAALILLLVAIGFGWLWFNASASSRRLSEQVTHANDAAEAARAANLEAQSLIGVLVASFANQVATAGVTPETAAIAEDLAEVMGNADLEALPDDQVLVSMAQLSKLGESLYLAGAFDAASAVLEASKKYSDEALADDAYSEAALVSHGVTLRYMGDLAMKENSIDDALFGFRTSSWAYDQLLRLVEQRPEWRAATAYNSMRIAQNLDAMGSQENALANFKDAFRAAKSLSASEEYMGLYREVRKTFTDYLRSRGDDAEAAEILAQ